MLKLILSITLTMMASVTFATSIAPSKTVNLVNDEVKLAIDLTNKYNVPLFHRGQCSSTSFLIREKTVSYNASEWTLESRSGVFSLDNEEIAELIKLRNRVDVGLGNIDPVLIPITVETVLYINGQSCGFTPYLWKVTFN